MTILFVIAFASAFYLALAILRVMLFARRPIERATEFLPTFTILKPLAGAEPQLYENLRSCCDQDYDSFFEVVLCLRSSDDPAFVTAKRLAIEYPSRIRIAIGESSDMVNPKIANLAKPGAEPRGEIVVIADSDICVGRDYLRSLASSFASDEIGATTCLYAGIPNGTPISRLGAMQIEEVFIPSVLVALALGPLRFCLGATMAVRRNVLEAIGGVAALGGTIADDHKLGELVTESGRRVEVSRYVVRTTVPERTLRALWTHELRWARTNFALAQAGYAFSFFIYALPLALLYLAVSRNLALGLPVVAVVAALRLMLHNLSRMALAVKRRDDALLIPIRDFLSLAVWFVGLFGRRVRWRSETYDTRC